MDPPFTIAPPSPESKSTCAKKRGADCEEIVLQDFLKKDFTLIAQNKKIMGIEVDLIFHKDHYVMVEVKSLSSFDRISCRLNFQQKQRLLRAQQYWQSFKDCPVQLVVAFVSRDNQILVLDIGDIN